LLGMRTSFVLAFEAWIGLNNTAIQACPLLPTTITYPSST
jgi:hypothetical protein